MGGSTVYIYMKQYCIYSTLADRIDNEHKKRKEPNPESKMHNPTHTCTSTNKGHLNAYTATL